MVEIVADAQKDSEILRGQGEAERNGIFADASSRDPSFYEFYRSMAAYRASFTSGGKTLVLPPNQSEFFKYFDSSGGSAPTSGTPALAAPSTTTPAN